MRFSSTLFQSDFAVMIGLSGLNTKFSETQGKSETLWGQLIWQMKLPNLDKHLFHEITPVSKSYIYLYFCIDIDTHTHICINTDTYLEKNSSSLPSPAEQFHIMQPSIHEFPYLATICLSECIFTDTKKKKKKKRTRRTNKIIKFLIQTLSSYVRLYFPKIHISHLILTSWLGWGVGAALATQHAGRDAAWLSRLGYKRIQLLPVNLLAVSPAAPFPSPKHNPLRSATLGVLR